jgi:hypothetical protein
MNPRSTIEAALAELPTGSADDLAAHLLAAGCVVDRHDGGDPISAWVKRRTGLTVIACAGSPRRVSRPALPAAVIYLRGGKLSCRVELPPVLEQLLTRFDARKYPALLAG